jgi:MFS family permease
MKSTNAGRTRSAAGLFLQRPVRPDELPAIMRKHIATGTMGSAWGNVITGIIYVYFGNAIGLTRLQWGILGGISSWVVVMQPLGTMLADRVGSRRLVWFWTALSDRVLRLVGIVGAFLLWRAGSTAGYLVFMTAVCLGTLVGNLSPGAWYGWLSTIIPRDVQGTFWGRRDSWISLIVILVTLPSGFLMDIVPREGKLETAALILAAVSLLGFLDILIHVTLPEPPMRAAPARGSLAGMLRPLKDRGFRPWLVFTACWNFSLMLGGGLSNLYFMENLGFRDDLFGGMIASTIVGLVGTLFAARRVGRMVDRFGVKRMLAASHLLWSFVPAIWLFATPGASALFWVGLGGVVGGVFSVAAANASVKLSTRFPSPEDSGMYMSIFSMIGSIAAGLGTLAAGLFLNAAGAWSVTLLGLVVSAFPVLFVLSTLGRFATLFTLLPRVRATPSASREERTFLLPLFFESLPGIERFRRRPPDVKG